LRGELTRGEGHEDLQEGHSKGWGEVIGGFKDCSALKYTRNGCAYMGGKGG